MQALYQDDWQEKFAWGEQKIFRTWPALPAEELLNSNALRNAGRSPAVDSWQGRQKRLCGNTNHYQLYIRADGDADSVDASGLTTFWVMRCKKYKECMPAQAVVSKEFATQFANLIASEAKALATWLSKTGIATATKGLDIDKFRHHFGFHCAVMQGYLPNSGHA